jgi:phasin family protein
MYLDLMSPSSLQQCNTAAEAVLACATEVFTGFGKMAELNVQTAKALFCEQQVLAGAGLSARSVSEVIDLQSQQLTAAFQKAFAYWRHVEEIAVETCIGFFTSAPGRFGISLTIPAEASDAGASAVAQQRPDETGLFVARQSAEVSAEAVSIVDSSGKVVSSNETRGDLH